MQICTFGTYVWLFIKRIIKKQYNVIFYHVDNYFLTIQFYGLRLHCGIDQNYVPVFFIITLTFIKFSIAEGIHGECTFIKTLQCW
jgi:hypothetical protein